jgi:hypothetical protein
MMAMAAAPLVNERPRYMCLLQCCLCALVWPVQLAYAELSAAVFGNTALAGIPVSNSTIAQLSTVLSLLRPWHSAVIQGQITAQEWALFSVDTDAGFVRLRVDDHLLVDGGPAAVPAPSCTFPGGDPSSVPGYLQWQDAWMPVNGTDDPHSMSSLGGDCTEGCSQHVCQALCEKLAPKGCIGFYTHKHQWNFCSMRKLGGDRWQDVLHATSAPCASCSTEHMDPGVCLYSCADCPVVRADTAYTRQASCPGHDGRSFCPAGAAAPPPGVGANGTAGYAVPIPFLPGRSYAKLRLELTLGAVLPTRLSLRINGTAVAASKLSATVSQHERRYDTERAAAEVGWNTWLSRDMLTHAWLPSGVALSVALIQGDATVEALGAQGPSCSSSKFPAKHGLHSVRGEYTEVESISVGSAGAAFRVESATAADTGLHLVITTLAVPSSADAGGGKMNRSVAAFAVLSLGMPISYRPRACNTSAHGTTALVGHCPGFAPVTVTATAGTTFLPLLGSNIGGASLRVQLAPTVGGTVSFIASASGSISARSTPVQTVAAARAALTQQLSKFGTHNETYAGLQASISWNLIFNPYEGIVAPVFRGAPWSASKPHDYVLFEWDTYLASMIATITDPWAAKSMLIRMTKALHFKGYVPGFWNGVVRVVAIMRPPIMRPPVHLRSIIGTFSA